MFRKKLPEWVEKEKARLLKEKIEKLRSMTDEEFLEELKNV